MGMIQVGKADASGNVVKFRLARTILGRPAYFTAAYWIDGVLIDTGCAHTARQLVSTLKGWRVDRVVNTHSHEDHIGANAAVQEAFRCPIQAHPDALPVLRNPRLQKLQLYRRLFWGWPEPCEAQAIGDRIETNRFCLQVIHTPGHSPGHICLFEPEQGWLFSGDTYIGGKDRALRAGYDIHGILNSLRKLAALPVATIFSGSGTVRENGTQPLEDKIAYLEELGQRIRALHDQGLSARRIRRRLFGLDLPITFVTLGHFSSMHLVRSYLAGFPPAEAVEAGPDLSHETNRNPDPKATEAQDPESTI
jgi:glyoxylase-like metal-dependent hydrolase (beta-lactamase superfamily II)